MDELDALEDELGAETVDAGSMPAYLQVVLPTVMLGAANVFPRLLLYATLLSVFGSRHAAPKCCPKLFWWMPGVVALQYFACYLPWACLAW